MTRDNKRLFRHLTIAVLIKLVVLSVLWWVFVRDAHVDVDSERVAEKINGAVSSQGVSK
ncbi:MAG: hypothetical protein HHJ09_10935 [Glaciimonas sp.]|nr:hypothetical protein [Glaciimonas sp.]